MATLYKTVLKVQNIFRVERLFKGRSQRVCIGSIYNTLLLPSSSARSFSLSCELSAKRGNELSDDVRETQQALTVGQKAKQAGKDTFWTGVIIFGVAVTGYLIYSVASELMFSFSPNIVYSKALALVKADSNVIYEIGDGMKGYGEETSRGRRRHINYQEYVVDEVNHMRVQFYVSGQKRKATVNADAVETSRGNFEFRYIFVELQGFPPSKPIIVLDNRI